MDSTPGAPDPGPPDGSEDEGPFFAWLPPEDRLWRHPSEALRSGAPAYPPESSYPPESPFGTLHRISSSLAPRPGWARTASVALVAGLVGALGASVIGLSSGWWGHTTTIVRSVGPSTPGVSLAEASGGATNWAAVEESVAASVVGVTVGGPAGPQEGSGLVILETDGGNSFVITDGSLFTPNQAAGYSGTVTVTFLSGEEARAKLVGQDALSGLALLEVPDLAREVPAASGSVADIREADPVLAVGARTLAGGSLSTGSVSGEDRTVGLSTGADMDSLIAVTMPALTPQATGGPLLDQYGRVVGITVNLNPSDPTDQAVTFAVPIDEATRVATQLIEGQRVTHAWLGVTNAEDVPATMAHQLGLTGGIEAGRIVAGSPAGQAGLRAHDIITSFAGRPVSSTGALVSTLVGLDPGSRVPVTYLHAGRSVSTTVVLAQEPGDS